MELTQNYHMISKTRQGIVDQLNEFIDYTQRVKGRRPVRVLIAKDQYQSVIGGKNKSLPKGERLYCDGVLVEIEP